MGNIGTPEIIIVLIVALLVLGPQRLPQAARQVGRAMGEFRRVTGGLQAEMRDAMSTIENEIKSATDTTDTAAPQAAPPARPYIFEPPAVPPAPDDSSEPPAPPVGAPGTMVMPPPEQPSEGDSAAEA